MIKLKRMMIKLKEEILTYYELQMCIAFAKKELKDLHTAFIAGKKYLNIHNEERLWQS